MQPTRHLELTLVLCCAALTALFGLACAFDDDGSLGGALCQTAGPFCSPDELCRPLPASDAQRLPAVPAAPTRLSASGLLAAVPGGLCLLI